MRLPQRREMAGKRATWSLWIVPAGVLVLGLLAAGARGPYFWSGNFDPEYCYLVNAANLLTLQPPAHTDHPGTTLQEFTAAVGLGRWLAEGLIREWEAPARAALARPEAYLGTVNLALNLTLFGLLYWAGRRILAAAGSLAPALIFQATFLLFHQFLPAQTRVSPEPLLMVTFAALAGLLAPLIARPDFAATPPGLRTAALAGATVGFGIVTKVTFAPVALLGLAFEGRRTRLRFLAGMAAAATVFLIPIYTQLPRVARWLWSLLTHEGRYGAGETGLPPLGALSGNAARLYAEEPFLFYLSGLFLAAVLLLRRRLPEPAGRRARNAWRFLAAGLAGIALSTAATVKHYAPHYALPAMLLAALLNTILAAWLLRRAAASRPMRAAAAAFCLVFVAGLAWSAWRIPGWFAARAAERAKELRLERILARFPDCRITGIYRSSLPVFALHFGNEFAAVRQQRILSALYPDTIHYARFIHHFKGFGAAFRDEQIAREIREGRCVLLVGQREAFADVRGFRWEVVGESGRLAVARLTGAELPAGRGR